MPSFAIKTTADLSELLNPVTLPMATEMITRAVHNDNGQTDAAIYYTSTNGKRIAIRVFVQIYGNDVPDALAHVWTDDYRPRKDGKAELIFQSAWVAKF